MKLLILLSVFCLCLIYCNAQKKQTPVKSIITTKRVYMSRNGEKDSLLIPVVSAKYPRLKAVLSEKEIFDGDALGDVVKAYETEGAGTTSLYYEVPFESKGIISILLYYEYMGAHPDTYERWETLNINTGKKYPINNEVNAEGLKWIYQTYKARYKKTLLDEQQDMEKNDDEYKKDPDTYNEFYTQLKEAIDSLSFKDMFTSYLFGSKGITFTTGRVLPHVVTALEPSREWFVPYNKLKKYKTATAIVLK